jgi:ATP-dependent RNA helicase DDX6/DHH1
MLAMDEGDKLLGEEFVAPLEELIGHMPPDRQILLFSATFPFQVRAAVARWQ